MRSVGSRVMDYPGQSMMNYTGIPISHGVHQRLTQRTLVSETWKCMCSWSPSFRPICVPIQNFQSFFFWGLISRQFFKRKRAYEDIVVFPSISAGFCVMQLVLFFNNTSRIYVRNTSSVPANPVRMDIAA